MGTNAADLEVWVREDLGLDPAATVQITEKPGTDPRCSDVITEVAVSSPGETPYSFHIEHPLAELSRMDVLAAIAVGGAH